MVRMFGLWLAVSFAIGLLIVFWQEATSKERWELTKTVMFATMCGLLASVLMGFVVVIF